MRYLIIDANLSGTGIRNQYEGGYIEPEALGLSSETTKKLKEWLHEYENEHYNSFENAETIEKLDIKGKELAKLIKAELTAIKIEYFSSALLIKERI